MTFIKLQTNDDQIFEIDVEVARCSGTINTMIDTLGEPSDSEPMLKLGNISGPILKLIFEWAEQHKDDVVVEIEDDDVYGPQKTHVPEWDLKFLTV